MDATRLRRLASFAPLIAAASIALACTEGTIAGGDVRFDANPPCVDDPSSEDAGGTGTTWNDLYRDYFGPTGIASCAGNGACHGATSELGAVGSGGYVVGHDVDSCYAGITNADHGLVHPKDAADPVDSLLYSILRKKCGGGTMPKSPPVAFNAADMKRIEAWIRAGVPRN